MSLYLKYRPKKFSQVRGQDHIVQTLTNALKQGRISHAYLLTGSRGLGKTTIARILAKAVNCVNKSIEPCAKCNACLEIAESRALDVLEIDAASNRGIEEIRELREKVKFASTSLPYKVYIIDEVHMLTKEAFNALLKTLEEPPAKTIFILATTEAHKIPLTIQSRCQRFDFRRPSVDELSAHLLEVAEQEKIAVEPAGVKLLAELANGSFRDAVSLLEQTATGQSNIINQLTADNIRRVLGLAEEQQVNDFITALISRDSKKCWQIIEEFYQRGGDLANFNQLIIQQLRQKMIAEENYQLATAIDLFAKAGNELKYASVATLPLELAAIEVTNQ